MAKRQLTKREIRAEEEKGRLVFSAIQADLQKEMQIKKFIRDMRGTVLHIERNNLFIERKQRQLTEGKIWEVLQEGNHVYPEQFKEPQIIQHEIEGLEHYKLQHIDEFYELTRRLEIFVPKERIVQVCSVVGADKLEELKGIVSDWVMGAKLDAKKDNQPKTE